VNDGIADILKEVAFQAAEWLHGSGITAMMKCEGRGADDVDVLVGTEQTQQHLQAFIQERRLGVAQSAQDLGSAGTVARTGTLAKLGRGLEYVAGPPDLQHAKSEVHRCLIEASSFAHARGRVAAWVRRSLPAAEVFAISNPARESQLART